MNGKSKAMVELLQQQSLDNTLHLNCGANVMYSSTVTFNELMECFTGSSEQQLKTDLHQSASLSSYVSCDVVFKTVFMDCVGVPNGKTLIK